MQESLTRIYKEYKLSRDSIQLTDAFVAHCSADALGDLNDAGLYEEAPLNALKLKHSYELVSDNVARGYLLSEVDVLTGKTNQTIAKFSIKVVGIFKPANEYSAMFQIIYCNPSLARSFADVIFLLTFIPASFGISTKNLPGRDISCVTRGPLCPTGSLTTCTTIFCLGLSLS